MTAIDEIDRRSVNTVERHLQTLIVVVIVGLLGWVGTTVQQTQVLVAKLTVEVEFLKQEVKRPSTKFEIIEQRLDSIETQLQIHMKDIDRPNGVGAHTNGR